MRWALAFLFWVNISICVASPSTKNQAQKLFKRLNGIPLAFSDDRLEKMAELIAENKTEDALKIASADDSFLRVTVEGFAAPLANQEFSPYDGPSEFTSLFMGIAKDNRDARELLTADYEYSVPRDYPLNVGTALNQYRLPERTREFAAGLLTTSTWAQAHLSGGTNRRAVKYAFHVFLCSPINQWREVGVSDQYVRRDVDRFPGGDASTYQNLCSTCHARMDAFAGAFARLDYFESGIRYVGKQNVVAKVNQNPLVSPFASNVIIDDFWEAIPSESFLSQFGFRTPLSGNGPRELGKLISHSDRFSSCMAERAFEKVCRRKPSAIERQNEIVRIAHRFESSQYQLKRLFEAPLLEPACFSEPTTQKRHWGVANFREALETLVSVTGVRANRGSIGKFYADGKRRLPKEGFKEELSESSLLAYTGLSGLFCKEWLADEKILESSKRRGHPGFDFLVPASFEPTLLRAQVQRYAHLFWQRPATEKEEAVLLKGLEGFFKAQTIMVSWADALLPLCSAMASSLETWIR